MLDFVTQLYASASNWIGGLDAGKIWKVGQLIQIMNPFAIIWLAVIGGFILYNQMKIAKKKVRSDLYERRYRKFEEIALMVTALAESGLQLNKADYLKVYSRCQNAMIDREFLFSKTTCSIIEEMLKVGHSLGRALFQSEMQNARQGFANDDTMFEISKCQKELSKLLVKLADVMKPLFK